MNLLHLLSMTCRIVNFVTAISCEKTSWWTVQEFRLKFCSFDAMPECDGQTDGRRVGLSSLAARDRASSVQDFRTDVQSLERTRATILWPAQPRCRHACPSISSFYRLQPYGSAVRQAVNCWVVGPQIWNDLPAEVTSAASLTTFRQRLKTHLFQNHFPATSWTLTNFPGH